MKRSNRSLLGLLPLSLLSGLAVMALRSPAPVAAAAYRHEVGSKSLKSAPHSESLSEAALQVDGMTSRVVDGVWESTDTYWHQGDFARCVALIRVCVVIDPTFVEAYSTGAWLLWSMDDTAGADALLADGAKRSPNHAQIEFEVGGQMFRTKRYPEAVNHFGKAVAAGDHSAITYSAYAHALEKAGRYDDAVKVWETQVKEHPEFGAGATNLKRAMALRDGKKSAPGN